MCVQTCHGAGYHGNYCFHRRLSLRADVVWWESSQGQNGRGYGSGLVFVCLIVGFVYSRLWLPHFMQLSIATLWPQASQAWFPLNLYPHHLAVKLFLLPNHEFLFLVSDMYTFLQSRWLVLPLPLQSGQVRKQQDMKKMVREVKVKAKGNRKRWWVKYEEEMVAEQSQYVCTCVCVFVRQGFTVVGQLIPTGNTLQRY